MARDARTYAPEQRAMTKSVCPTASIAAPIERVWALLTTLASYGDWWDATTERIVPGGPAAPGQIVYARAHALGMLHLPVTVTVEQVDAPKHRLDLTTRLPLGITVHNHIACAPITQNTTWLQFGWDFTFLPGWRGWLVEHTMDRQIHHGVADALNRIKRAAERSAAAINTKTT